MTHSTEPPTGEACTNITSLGVLATLTGVKNFIISAIEL